MFMLVVLSAFGQSPPPLKRPIQEDLGPVLGPLVVPVGSSCSRTSFLQYSSEIEGHVGTLFGVRAPGVWTFGPVVVQSCPCLSTRLS